MKDPFAKIKERLADVYQSFQESRRQEKDEKIIPADKWAEFAPNLVQLQKRSSHGFRLLQVDPDEAEKVYPQDRLIESFANLSAEVENYLHALIKSSDKVDHLVQFEQKGKRLIGHMTPTCLENIPWSEEYPTFGHIIINEVRETKNGVVIKSKDNSLAISQLVDENTEKFDLLFQFDTGRIYLRKGEDIQIIRAERFRRDMRSRHTFDFASRDLEEYIATVNKISEAADFFVDALKVEIERLGKL